MFWSRVLFPAASQWLTASCDFSSRWFRFPFLTSVDYKHVLIHRHACRENIYTYKITFNSLFLKKGKQYALFIFSFPTASSMLYLTRKKFTSNPSPITALKKSTPWSDFHLFFKCYSVFCHRWHTHIPEFYGGISSYFSI